MKEKEFFNEKNKDERKRNKKSSTKQGPFKVATLVHYAIYFFRYFVWRIKCKPLKSVHFAISIVNHQFQFANPMANIRSFYTPTLSGIDACNIK